jgi:hypothetical protein
MRAFMRMLVGLGLFGLGLIACGARSSTFDDGIGGAASFGNGAGAGIGTSSTTSSAGGGGTTGTTASVGTGGDGTPIGQACGAFLGAIEHANEPACEQCLGTAPSGTCVAQIKKVTKITGDCANANACVAACAPEAYCACVEECLSGAPKKCTTLFENAFWCVSGACGNVCL